MLPWPEINTDVHLVRRLKNVLSDKLLDLKGKTEDAHFSTGTCFVQAAVVPRTQLDHIYVNTPVVKVSRESTHVPPTPETTGPQQLNPSGPKGYFNIFVITNISPWDLHFMSLNIREEEELS